MSWPSQNHLQTTTASVIKDWKDPEKGNEEEAYKVTKKKKEFTRDDDQEFPPLIV